MGKGTGGVYRTTNGGVTWNQVSALEANGTPLQASDGAIYWLLMFDRGVIRSNDRGESRTQVCGSGLLKGATLIELPDGKLAAVGNKSVKVSSDHGDLGSRCDIGTRATRWSYLCPGTPGFLHLALGLWKPGSHERGLAA